MFEYEAIDHIALSVHDPKTMLAFYVDTLGCKVERIYEDKGQYLLRAGNAIIALKAIKEGVDRNARRNMDHICLRLKHFDAEAIHRELTAKGVSCGKALPKDGATGESLAYFIRDPEGNAIELKAPVTAG
ncbi:MAG TPA: VOC family protein [Nevskiaceae bacterium]|nr:VOC family protein [Nevskiaceae bacterium]